MAADRMVKENESYDDGNRNPRQPVLQLGMVLADPNSGIGGSAFRPEIVWNPILVTTLRIEFTLIALLLGLTVFLQTRKRDFI